MNDDKTYWLTLPIDKDMKETLWYIEKVISAAEYLDDKGRVFPPGYSPFSAGKVCKALEALGLNAWCEDAEH